MRKLTRRKRDVAVEEVLNSVNGCENEAPVEFISSGCTTLNLALSGKGADGGWPRGRVSNIVGDGSSGKSLLALEAGFWFYKNIRKVRSKIFPRVKKPIIVYNNVEGVMDFPVAQMYGLRFVNAVEWTRSPTIEKMGRDYIRRMKNLQEGESILYIVDSWDALDDKSSQENFEKSIEEDKDLPGSYNLDKQKYSGKFFRHVCDRCENNKKDASLIIISQVRTKINAMFGKKQYRAGGKALDFYTHVALWIREAKKLKKIIKKHERVYGIKCAGKVERSKVAKPFRESEFQILYDYGLDDLSSMIDFLYGSSDKVKMEWEGEVHNRQSLIKLIEGKNLENELQEKTEEVWQNIEQTFTNKIKSRKRRF